MQRARTISPCSHIDESTETLYIHIHWTVAFVSVTQSHSHCNIYALKGIKREAGKNEIEEAIRNCCVCVNVNCMHTAPGEWRAKCLGSWKRNEKNTVECLYIGNRVTYSKQQQQQQQQKMGLLHVNNTHHSNFLFC